MAITLTQLRREVGQDIGECVVGTVDLASTAFLQDDDLIDLDANDTEYDHAWIRCYWEDGAGTLYDETRRVRVTDPDTGVKGYDPATGSIYVSRNWSYVMPANTQYEIHKLVDPVQLDRLLLNAVQRCQHLYLLALTPVSNQLIYDLSSYTWLTSPVQVVDVTYAYRPTDTDDARHYPLRQWYVYRKSGGGLELHTTAQSVTSGDKLYVHVIRPHGDDLGTDDGEDIDERWAKAAALNEVYMYLVHNGPAQDVERYRAMARLYAARFTEQSRKHAPRFRAIPRHSDEPRD
jgi:hypothetical protein